VHSYYSISPYFAQTCLKESVYQSHSLYHSLFVVRFITSLLQGGGRRVVSKRLTSATAGCYGVIHYLLHEVPVEIPFGADISVQASRSVSEIHLR